MLEGIFASVEDCKPVVTPNQNDPMEYTVSMKINLKSIKKRNTVININGINQNYNNTNNSILQTNNSFVDCDNKNVLEFNTELLNDNNHVINAEDTINFQLTHTNLGTNYNITNYNLTNDLQGNLNTNNLNLNNNNANTNMYSTSMFRPSLIIDDKMIKEIEDEIARQAEKRSSEINFNDINNINNSNLIISSFVSEIDCDNESDNDYDSRNNSKNSLPKIQQDETFNTMSQFETNMLNMNLKNKVLADQFESNVKY
jgi:hypothetical protein